MRSSVRQNVWFLVAAAAIAGVAGCGSSSGDTIPGSSSGGKGGGSTGSGGVVGSGGSTPAGSGGSTPTGSGGTPAPTDASVPVDTGATDTAATDTAGTDTAPPATGDWMGYPGVKDQSQVLPTEGCGKALTDLTAGTWKAFTISGIPTPPGQRDNPGTGTRKYFARVPTGYKPDTKYKVLIAASSCTGGNQELAAMGDVGEVTDATGGAILISPVVEPGVWDPDQCYDDKDPNSIEHPFFERFMAQVGSKVCYDKNKVFVEGHSSGGWYSNMIGWVHTTDSVRAISSNGGGLPDDSGERPILNGKPMAGLWIHPQGDTEQPLAARRAVSRALVVNKCMGAGTDPTNEMIYTTAPSADWNMGGSVNCKKYMCPAAFPVIFCTPPGTHQNLSWHADATWAMFNSLP